MCKAIRFFVSGRRGGQVPLNWFGFPRLERRETIPFHSSTPVQITQLEGSLVVAAWCFSGNDWFIFQVSQLNDILTPLLFYVLQIKNHQRPSFVLLFLVLHIIVFFLWNHLFPVCLLIPVVGCSF